MSTISEQVKYLRNFTCFGTVKQAMIEAADTIESLSAKLSAANLERSAEGGEWISCKDGLPENDEKVLVWFEYFRYGEYNRLFQTIGISYMYGGKWSGFVNDTSGWDKLRIVAWQPLPQPYKGE